MRFSNARAYGSASAAPRRERQSSGKGERSSREEGAPHEADADWELIPFDRIKVDALEREWFPGVLGEMAVAVAEHTETPLELTAPLALGCLSVTISRKIEVEPEPGYCEPTNLHTCAAMESGARKTAALDAPAAPLREWEAAETERTEPERKRTYSLRFPEKRLGQRKLESRRIPTGIKQRSRDSFCWLLSLSPPRSAYLHFTPEAYAVWKEFQRARQRGLPIVGICTGIESAFVPSLLLRELRFVLRSHCGPACSIARSFPASRGQAPGKDVALTFRDS